MSQMTLQGRLPRGRFGKLLATRKGMLAIGTLAALLAAALIAVYLNRYRASIEAGAQPTPVLVAQRLITKGTPVSVIATQKFFEVREVPRDHVKTGAVTDIDTLRGRVAAQDLYPGQQLSLSDFGASTFSLQTRVTGQQRALAVALDNVKGMPGFVQPGDRIDVWMSLQAQIGGVAKPVVKLLLPNVMVLAAPSPGQSSYFILRVAGDDVGRLAYAAEHAQLRFVVRPSGNAKPLEIKPFTQEDLLFGRGKG